MKAVYFVIYEDIVLGNREEGRSSMLRFQGMMLDFDVEHESRLFCDLWRYSPR